MTTSASRRDPHGWRWRERLVLLFLVVAWFSSSYFGTAWWNAGREQAELETFLDEWVPFVPGAVYVYATIYPGALLPMFLLPRVRELARVATVYAVVIGICSVFFLLFPVGADGWRPDLARVAAAPSTLWGLGLVYELDPPRNLFPSLHVGLAVCAVAASWPHVRRLRVLLLLWVLAVAWSACATRQHYAVDVVAGAALALGVHGLACRRSVVSRTGPIERAVSS